jgi:hypothetical protein
MELEPMNDVEKHVEKLIEKAVGSDNSDAALKYSQAALNVAHANQVLAQVKQIQV